MGAVNLDKIEARAHGAGRGRLECLEHAENLGFGHFPGCGPPLRHRDSAGCDRFPGL